MKRAILLAAVGALLFAGAPRDVSASDDAKYVGLSRCKMCHGAMHKNIWERWEKGKHAGAGKVMFAKFSGSDVSKCRMCHPAGQKIWEKGKATCFYCHATGYAFGGYDPDDPKTFADFTGVTCEACHGPGSAHASNPSDAAFKKRRPRCYKCHFRVPLTGMHKHNRLLHGRN